MEGKLESLDVWRVNASASLPGNLNVVGHRVLGCDWRALVVRVAASLRTPWYQQSSLYTMASPVEDNSERNVVSLPFPSTLSDNNNNRKRTSDEMLKSANKSDRLSSGDNGAFVESSQSTGTGATVGDGAPSSGIHMEPSRDSRLSSEDLLAPIARYDWDEFQEQCRNGMHRLGAEEEGLMEQYAQWEWV